MSLIKDPEVSKPSLADRIGRIKQRIVLVVWILVFGLLGYFLYPSLKSFYALSKTQNSYYLITVVEGKASYQRSDKKPDEWVPLKEISPYIQGAIISSEDGKFYQHPGYDLEQLTDAIEDSIKTRKSKKKKIRGASTITQQLVKNLFLSSERNLFRKGQELLMALAIEKHADKKKILETYLNVIEYGKGLYGIGNATKFYFNKKPNQVSPREAAFLAMLLPSPIKYARSYQMKSLTPFAQRMIESILFKMRQGGYVSEEVYLDQLNSRFSWEKGPADSPIVSNLQNEGEEEGEGDIL